MSIQLRSVVFVALSILASACGDDPEKAQDKCESLVNTYCSRIVSCAQDADLLGDDFTAGDLKDECQEFMLDNAHCEDAVRVADKFGTCIDQAKQSSCDDLTDALGASTDLSERYLSALPTSCQGAVLYSE